MRERGVQARRARAAEGEPQVPTPPPGRGLRFWQGLAILALIAASAGWATVAVMALRSTPAEEALASPVDEPFPTDDAGLEPAIESHAAPSLEAVLPAEVDGTSLARESWTGDTFLGDDSWGSALATFLTGAGQTVADLEVSQAYDASGVLDLSAGAFRVAGIEPAALLDAMIAAWKADYPDLSVAQTTVGGLAITTVDFGDGAVSSYWYLRDGVVFDIESSDPAIAEAAFNALPRDGAPSLVPSSAAPAAS